MKKLLLLLVVVLAFASCKKDRNIPFDGNRLVLIKPAKELATRTKNPKHLTGLEIVEQTWTMYFKSHYFDNAYREVATDFNRGFSDNQRDYDLPALKMWGTDIITFDGKMIKDFIQGFDMVLLSKDDDVLDTIAYVPNNVLRNADIKIRAAFAEGNFEEVYKLFDEAFVFIPITANEWKNLKSQDLN